MNKKRAPILLYHGVAESRGDAIRDPYYALPVASVKAQLEWLRRNRFVAASLDELLSFTAGWEHRCTITIDDGLLSAYTHLFPLLLDAGFPAIVFPVAGMVGRAGWVSWQQLGEMVRDGMGVGSHTMSHANLSQLSRHEVREELAGSRKLLEDTLGTQVKYLSLPGGYRGSALGPLAAEAGYDGICCSMFGYNKFPADRYGLKRFCMRGSDSMEIVRRIMRAELIPLLPRFLRERGRNLCKRLIGERIYGALRAMLIPRGVHATLPRFPPE